MNFDILHIILAVVTLLAGVFAFAYYNFIKNKSKTVDRQIEKIKQAFEKDIEEKNLEVNRLNLIVNDYKKQLYKGKQKFKDTHPASTIPENNKNENAKDVDYELKNLAQQKRELEKEKQKFQDKNKKLWEQSIAIHKEKERIDGLKREIERKHKEVTDSIKYAQRIQSALLPSIDVLKELLYEHFIFWRPRDIVSGDFYWIKKIQNKVIIVVADCTGHGVPGAFVSMLGISFLNEIISSKRAAEGFTAASIIEDLRTKVKISLSQKGDEKEQKDGMDMALCVIDTGDLTMEYAGANNPLYLIRKGELQITKATKNPVGIYVREKPFENHVFQLERNDHLYLFSDGYVDQFGGGVKGQKFKSSRFKKLINEIYHKSMTEQYEIIERTFYEWKGERYPQLDDVLVMGIKI